MAIAIIKPESFKKKTLLISAHGHGYLFIKPLIIGPSTEWELYCVFMGYTFPQVKSLCDRSEVMHANKEDLPKECELQINKYNEDFFEATS